MGTRTGGDLFIVDNSEDGWTGLRYLEEWTDIASSFDIATGYFDIGALLSLNGKWQKLDKIRILMGVETTSKTRAIILKSAQDKGVAVLNESLEDEKPGNPLLDGVTEIQEAIRSGRIEVRVYAKDKFHAKAYITHSSLNVIGSQALVGSSNFTKPGLSQNVELNLRIENSNDVEDLQEWFERYWAESDDASALLVEAIDRHTRLYSPFDIYAKALHELFRGTELPASDWDQTQSLIFPILDQYQKEAYGALLKIAEQHSGAFLCDGVGLGKTFVGLMLIERLVMHEGKRVLLLAPKGAREGVWDPHLEEYLPHIGGLGASDFSNLAVFNHTDLTRGGDFPERFRRIAELADAVVIDEAHHFRNPGRVGDDATGVLPSRYRRLYDLLDPEPRSKEVYLLTATPINNQLSDFRHMAELFTRGHEAYFRGSIGVNNLRSHFGNLEKELQKRLQKREAIADDIADAEEVLEADKVFKSLVVQRSRAYAKDSQIQEKGVATSFPERKSPQVAAYSVKKTYGQLLENFEKAFEKQNPLFSLPMYYPLAWYTGDDDTIDPLEENRQKQVVGLIRTQFLKRFESSVAAFEISCDRLLRKLLAFVEVHSHSDGDQSRLERWKRQNDQVLSYAHGIQLDLWGAEPVDNEEDDTAVPPEMLEAVEVLDPNEYDLSRMLDETYLDMDELVQFLTETRRFEAKNDDKLQKLIRLLRTVRLKDEKMLIFTEFTDTARYLARELKAAGIEGVEQIDGSRKLNRGEVIRRFAPYYNRSSSPALEKAGEQEIRVLISTDVLSEGLNLQDATRMLNYDIHWNPVRLMQRIGRVDRRLNPEIEIQLVADHPELEKTRGIIEYWNFLPPDELNTILSLYTTVTRKALLISETLGIEGGQLLSPEDEYQLLQNFSHAYEGRKSAVEEMHLEYQALVNADPGLEARLDAFPSAVFSGRSELEEGHSGVFFCYSLPGLDRNADEFTYAAGTTAWYFLADGVDDIVEVPDDLLGEASSWHVLQEGQSHVLEQPGEIVRSVRSIPEDNRIVSRDGTTLADARAAIEKHIRNTYTKRVDAPVTAPKPKLQCWMEVGS